MRQRLLPLLTGLAFVAAACSSAAPTTPPASVRVMPSATAGASATAAGSAAGASTPGASSTAAATAAPPAPGDWPVYHLDASRTALSAGFPAPTSTLVKAWAAKLDGAVYAQPLVVGGRVIAATEGDSIYALDPRDGSVVWRQNVGTPVRKSSLPCGNIDPLGITGTPAYDPATNSLFAVAEVTGFHHVLFALDPQTGAVRWSRTIDVAGDDPRTHQQRPALAVANGYVYVGFGGLAGDCGQYRGKVVGVPASGQGETISYIVPVAREGAVWATGGPVVDAAGNLYVSTGNGSSTSKTHYDGSDSVVELSPKLEMISRFAPSGWAEDNAGDADLGSLSPVLLPNGFVFIAGKSGTGYVLRQGNLGGIGGQVSSASVCGAFGGAAADGNVAYVPCTSSVVALAVGSDGSIDVRWRSQDGGGPPAIGGGAVWTVDTGSGRLFALDQATGTTLTQIAVGSVPHFASPSLWDGLVLVGTTSGVVAVRV